MTRLLALLLAVAGCRDADPVAHYRLDNPQRPLLGTIQGDHFVSCEGAAFALSALNSLPVEVGAQCREATQ